MSDAEDRAAREEAAPPDDLPRDPYRAVFERSPDGILVVDAEGTIREANPRIEEMFGWDREELLGSSVEVLVPEDGREAHVRARRGYVEDPHARPMGVGLELRGLRRDGTAFPVEISLSPIRTGRGLFVVSSIRDVTERRRLRDFGVGSLRAAEDERQRIARELHDDTAQRLAGLLIRMRLARRTEDAARRNELLEEAREEILEAAESVRRIARGLRPPALADAGLVAAIRWHVRSQAEPAEAAVDLDLYDVDDVLDAEGKLVVYRVVQEALSNALRHADANRVAVRMIHGDGKLVVEVADDGRGFEPDRALARVESGGLGLLGMHERAHLVGGELEIDSRPDAGTTVRLSVPTNSSRKVDDV